MSHQLPKKKARTPVTKIKKRRATKQKQGFIESGYRSIIKYDPNFTQTIQRRNPNSTKIFY